MRPRISWADLRGRRVGVWGIGAEGRANLRRLRAMGTEPVLVDDKPDQVRDEVVLPTAGKGLEALLACDVVVKSPGIPRTKPEVHQLEAAGVPVVGGLGLWVEGADRSRVLCITGTKGKSTTTSVAAHLARGLGLRVFAGGNLGSPPWDPDTEAESAGTDLWVIETSSYQATDIASTPPVVGVTSLHPDHLVWHGGVDAYYRDKLSLCTQPGAHLTVASALSPLLVERRDQLGPVVEWVSADTYPPGWAEPLGLLGEHNVVNASIARACLAAMGVPGTDDEDALRAAAAGFTPLESRLETVASVGGVDFVDDGLSTNVLSTLAAVDAFPGRRLVLIAGGLDRDIDYAPLAEGLARRNAPTLVLTTYTTGPTIQREVERHAGPLLEARPCADLHEAARYGAEWARPDGAVLLSPAAASFDAFENYRHKGRVFREAVAALAGPA